LTKIKSALGLRAKSFRPDRCREQRRSMSSQWLMCINSFT